MLMPIVSAYTRPSLQTALSIGLTSDTGTALTTTIVVKIAASSLSRTGSLVQVRIASTLAADTTLAACYIGPSATSGNAWNFASTPTQVLFEGASGATMQAGSTILSDVTAFDSAASPSFSIAFAVTTSRLRFLSTGATGITSYRLDGTSEANLTTKSTGYSAFAGRVFSVTELLVA